MKSAGFSLLCLVVTGSLAAQPAEPFPPTKTSSRVTQEIRSGLPKYEPFILPPSNNTEPAASDPDVFVLPKFTVKEKRIPTNDPDVWRTERVIQQRAMTAYKGSMTPLEWALNSWFVPPFSAPASVRARAAYQENKLAAEYSQLTHIAEVGRQADSKAAALLKKAVLDMQNADEWQRRPAGK